MGVHLNLSDGNPVAAASEVKSLLNERGEFARRTGSACCCGWRRRAWTLKEVERNGTRKLKRCAAGIRPTHLDGHKHVQMLPGLFEIALRLAKRHGIAAMRVSHEESSLRAALTGGSEAASVMLKQGVQARGLKLLARDAREMAEHAGIATADYFCGIAQTGELTKKGVQQLLAKFAGRHDRTDVPPRLRRCRFAEIGDPAARIAANRARDTD